VGVRLATANEREVASTVTAQQKAVALSATGDQRLYGQVKSLERKGDHYELRFDPPLLPLRGGRQRRPSRGPAHSLPAKRVSSCGERQLRRRRGPPPADLPRPGRGAGTVLNKSGSSGGPFPATTITAAQLAQIIAGQSSLKLFEPLSTGVWIPSTRTRFAPSPSSTAVGGQPQRSSFPRETALRGGFAPTSRADPARAPTGMPAGYRPTRNARARTWAATSIR
jgi:hypothetical protein